MAIVHINGVPMKRCPTCEQMLSVDNFGIGNTRKDGLSAHCKPCFREYRLAHYRANPAPYKSRARARTTDLKAFMRALKDAPCTDCGVKHPPYVMQWDHIRGEKKHNPSEMWGTNRERILEEIAKCELVCANCHAVRTFERSASRELV